MIYRLQKIDDLTRKKHRYLAEDDVCYYYGEYTSGEDYSYSETNQLIKNLKKNVLTANKNEIQYKYAAISQIAQLVVRLDKLKDFTFVPTPPSKCATHPEYDDRMLTILRVVKSVIPVIDFRELITQKDSVTASHTIKNNPRPKPEEVATNYNFNHNLVSGIRQNIVIFDDVLTEGSHYKAMKTVIKQHLPDIQITGLFVARTVRKEKYEIDNSDDDDENFLRDFDHFSHY
ncbi:hypothetical protein [Xenorhabdus bovienii]|uniref:hypothetical protein n=1 Tax=Xenorhabdus bovienii TaxID=40576 RepID=UPI003DA65101